MFPSVSSRFAFRFAPEIEQNTCRRMYKDNGKLNVELLADVGDIAHRLRNLDEKLALNLDDPRYQQAIQHYGPPSISLASAATIDSSSAADSQCPDTSAAIAEPIAASPPQPPAPPPQQPQPSSAPSTSLPLAASTTPPSASPHQRRRSSAAQIAHNIGEKISDLGPSTQHRRYSNKQVEDIILDFYEKHLIFHQNREKEKFAAVAHELSETLPHSCLFQSTGDDAANMNNLPMSTASGKCSTSDTSHGAQAPSDDQSTGDRLPSIKTAVSVIQHESQPPLKRHSITQPMPEIQISSSDELTKPRKSLTDQLLSRDPSSSGYDDIVSIVLEGTSSGRSAGSCSHYCSGWQTMLFDGQLNDDDLRTLVMELKHKVEFTERMNWLCKYTDGP